MIKINISRFRSEFTRGNHLFIISFKDNKIVIKRINKLNNYFREVFILNLDNFQVDINISPKTNMPYIKIDEILDNFKNSFKSNVILYDMLNIDELFKNIKLNYKKILISGGTIGLTNHFYNMEEDNFYIYDIVLLETNEIIGEIRGSNKLGSYKTFIKTNYHMFIDEAKSLLLKYRRNNNGYLKLLVNNS